MKNRVQLSPLGDEKEGGEAPAPAEQNEATPNVEETSTPDSEDEEGSDNTGE